MRLQCVAISITCSTTSSVRSAGLNYISLPSVYNTLLLPSVYNTLLLLSVYNTLLLPSVYNTLLLPSVYNTLLLPSVYNTLLLHHKCGTFSWEDKLMQSNIRQLPHKMQEISEKYTDRKQHLNNNNFNNTHGEK